MKGSEAVLGGAGNTIGMGLGRIEACERRNWVRIGPESEMFAMPTKQTPAKMFILSQYQAISCKGELRTFDCDE